MANGLDYLPDSRMTACEERIRLTKEFAVTTSALFEATVDMQSKRGLLFLEALGISKLASTKCGKARRALSKHTREHRC